MSDIRSDATDLIAESFAPEQEIPANQEVSSETESFTSLDPNSLHEDLLPYYKSMQADYTKKTQTIAEQRRALEALDGVDPTLAAQAVQFVDRLQTDPTFALEIHRGLSTALEQSGLMPHEAEQLATQTMNDAMEMEDQSQYMEQDPRLQELFDWKEQQEQQQLEHQISMALERQEMAIRQAHPEYSDDDVNAVYQLAFAYAGDLQAANQVYQNMRQSIVSNYLTQKSQVPSTPPPAGGYSAQAPEILKNSNEISEAAIRRIMQAMES